MSYGYQQQPARRSGMTTAGRWMFFIGLVLSVITGAAVAWGGVQLARLADDVSNNTLSFENGSATVPMEEGDLRFVLNESSGSETPTCTVTDPGGTQSPLDADGQMVAQADVEVLGTFQATTSGEHTFTCDGGNPALSPNLGTNLIIGAVVAGVGVLVLIPLGLMTVIGLILWLVGRGRDQRAQQGPPGGGYSGQGGYSGPEYPAQPGQQAYPGEPGQQAYPGQTSQGQGQPDQGGYPGPDSPYLRPNPEDDTRR